MRSIGNEGHNLFPFRKYPLPTMTGNGEMEVEGMLRKDVICGSMILHVLLESTKMVTRYGTD